MDIKNFYLMYKDVMGSLEGWKDFPQKQNRRQKEVKNFLSLTLQRTLHTVPPTQYLIQWLRKLVEVRAGGSKIQVLGGYILGNVYIDLTVDNTGTFTILAVLHLW